MNVETFDRFGCFSEFSYTVEPAYIGLGNLGSSPVFRAEASRAESMVGEQSRFV